MSLFDYDYEKVFEGDETVTVAKPDATVATADGEKIEDVTGDVDKNETAAAATTAATNTATEGGRAKNPKGKKAKKTAKRRRSVREDGEADNPAELTDDELAGLDGEDAAPSDAVDKEMDPASTEEDGEVPDVAIVSDDSEDDVASDEGGVDGDTAAEVPAADAQPAAEDDDAPAPALPAQPAPDDTIANAPAEMPAADVAAAITPAEKAEDVAAADSVDSDDVTDVQAAPAIDECKEQANFFCLEQVKVNIAFDKVDKVCTEAWVKSGTDYQKAVVTENFKESAKKYWERFKAFLVRVKNLVKRTAIRVLNYLKRVFTAALAKIAAKLGKKNFEAYKDRLVQINVKTFEHADDSLEGIKKRIEGASATGKGSNIETLERMLKEASDAPNDKETVSNIKEHLKSSEELFTDIMGKPCNYFGDRFKNALQDINNYKKLFDSVVKAQGDVNKAISTAEATMKTAKDLDTNTMTVKVAIINTLVSVYTRKLGAINKAAIAWLRARITVLNQIFHKSKKDMPDVMAKKEGPEDAKESYYGSDLLSQYMSMI